MEEELYYPSRENKGADQLRGYREADLRLCFLLCRLLVFPRDGSYGKPLTLLIKCKTNCFEYEIHVHLMNFIQITFIICKVYITILHMKKVQNKMQGRCFQDLSVNCPMALHNFQLAHLQREGDMHFFCLA